jgi:hypothetical protein
MLQPSASENGSSLVLLEGGLTAIAIAAAFAWPRLGNTWITRIEQGFNKLARKRGLAVALVGIATFLLRLSILPILPVPLPFNPNDFSNSLAADTFAHGRLTNPTPAMWAHFESVHISMQPTYMTMYFPAEGLLLAAGKVLFGSPWIAVLCASALMCAAICWMLQAWLPPSWALLGGILAILRLGLFSYWINTYSGAGLISALGGALVLGALPRLVKTARFRYGLLLAVGIALLPLSRPYEGLLLCLPVAVVLGRWAFFGKNRPAPAVLLRRAAVPLLLIVAIGAWLGYYDYRAFGSPTTLPYTLNRETYAMAPYFIWQSARPAPHYRHELMRRFYYDVELTAYQRVHSWSLYLPMALEKIWATLQFYSGLALLVPIFMLRRVFHDRRTRFLVVCVLVLMAGNLIMIYMLPHYLAPFTAAFYAIGLQAMRHLRVWSAEGKPVGRALVRSAVVICVLMACVRPFAEPLGFRIPEWEATQWEGTWIGPEHFGVERAQIETQLEQLPGNQLVMVRYAPGHPPGNQWVYNNADIDGSKVVWAWDMGAADNLELVKYYHDRKVWLVEPDKTPVAIGQYTIPVESSAAAH